MSFYINIQYIERLYEVKSKINFFFYISINHNINSYYISHLNLIYIKIKIVEKISKRYCV